MTYPYSPFGCKFDVISICELNYKRHGEHVRKVDNTEVTDLDRLLRWLCTPPKTTSYRVNTSKYDIKQVKNWLYDRLKNICHYYEEDVTSMISEHPVLTEVLLLKNFPPRTNPRGNSKEVIVDPQCAAAILRGSHLFAPGVIGMQSGTKPGDPVNVFADLKNKCKKGLKILYEDDHKLFLGTGTVLMARHQLFGDLPSRGVAVQMMTTVSGVPSLDLVGLPEDAALLQNIPSVVCALALNPSQDETVLDMCASPGNKTTHLGAIMKQGVLVAIDKTRKKLDVLRSNCEKHSLGFVRCYEFDSTRLYQPDGSTVEMGPPFGKEVFDKILLDAPCSNLGRRPQLFNNITQKEARSYVPLQRKLFTNAVRLLKPGGHLVYSTCTVMLAENEGIVSWGLENFPELELLPVKPNLGGPGWTGTDLTDTQRNLLQRYGPEGDTVGFFIAHFLKTTPI